MLNWILSLSFLAVWFFLGSANQEMPLPAGFLPKVQGISDRQMQRVFFRDALVLIFYRAKFRLEKKPFGKKAQKVRGRGALSCLLNLKRTRSRVLLGDGTFWVQQTLSDSFDLAAD